MKKELCVLLAMICLAAVLSVTGARAEDCVRLSAGRVFDESYSNRTVSACSGDYSMAAPGVFVTINASNFVLDCGGASITGAKAGTGILIGEVEDVTIEGCSLARFETGVLAEGAVNLKLFNLAVERSTKGVVCDGVVRGSVRAGRFSSNNIGAVLDDTWVLDVEASEFGSNGVGLFVAGTETSVFKGNSFLNNSVGLKVTGSTGLRVYKNLFKSERNVNVSGVDAADILWDFAKEGNYWSDYDASLDSDSDGIGDVPYVIFSDANVSAGRDNYPFVSENLSTAAAYVLEEREGTFENLRNGHSVSFVCDGEAEFVLRLVSASDGRFSIANKTVVLDGKLGVDFDDNGAPDVMLFLVRNNIESLDVKVVRLGDCVSYCGDGVCLPPESAESCAEDCVERDEDGDGVMASEGDCDDSDSSVYPGAEEACSPTVDSDCDGLIGDEDPDCQGLGFGFWFWLLIFLAAAGAAGYFGFIMLKKKKSGDSKGEKEAKVEKSDDAGKGELAAAPKPKKPKKKVAGIGKVKRYAKRYLDQGMDSESIKQTLLAQGWSADKIDAAIAELEGEM